MLWTFHSPELESMPVLAVSKGAIAKSLETLCPNHPSAVEEMILNRWPDTRARAADIERAMGTHPQVAFALAHAYQSDGRFDDAIRLLQQVIDISPDRDVYEELAETYKQKGYADKWLEIREKYLATTEDFGLEHARTNEQIAYTLLGMGKPEKALVYAKSAAQSYSGWGLQVYATCLTELRRFDEAEQVEKADQERYPNGFRWYRWCQTTGRGDLKGAQAMSERLATQIEASTKVRELSEVGIYLLLEGQTERARVCFDRQFRAKPDGYEGMHLCVCLIQQGKLDTANDVLDSVNMSEPAVFEELAKRAGNLTPRPKNKRTEIYIAAVSEMQRCLANPAVTPARDGNVKIILDAIDSPYRANCTYFFGRLCELRGKIEDAKWWYRTSMETKEWTASCRPLAAAGLRRLGEELYK